MSQPVKEYVADRVGQVWTQADAEFVADKIRQIERLAESVVLRVEDELRKSGIEKR